MRRKCGVHRKRGHTQCYWGSAAGSHGGDCLDLRHANTRQLLDAGLAPERIHHLDDCTACLPDDYPSYRRDGKGAGRMVSFIGWER